MNNEESKNQHSEDDEKTILGRSEGDTTRMPIISRDDGEGSADPALGGAEGPIGTTADDRFTLTQVLGEGSQGEVCRAFDNHLQREVAIKFPHRRSDMKAADILDEARKAARLNHPNAVTVYECGFWQGRPFICMELVEGSSLAHLIKDVGRLSVDRWARYMQQILAGLEAAHRSGLIHRDLKPQNVIVARDGSLKLTDFGIAHVAKGPKTRQTSYNNVLAGTPMYMSPEQWDGESPDAQSDIYALGCMSYVMLSGRAPFTGSNVMSEHLLNSPPDLRERVPSLPASVAQVAKRCIAKKPSERFQSCAELQAAIDQALRETEAVVISPTETKRSFPTKIVLGLALLGALGWFFGMQDKGIELRQKALQALGLAKSVDSTTDADRKSSGGDEPSDSDNQNANDGDTNNIGANEGEVSEAQRRRLEGLELLSRAEVADSLDEKLSLAKQAASLLQGTDRERARAIVKSANDTIDSASMTENAAAIAFNAALKDVRKHMDSGDFNAALQALDRAEQTMKQQSALASRDRELKLLRIPVMIALAERAGAEGRFDDAQGLFADSSGLADFVGDPDRQRAFEAQALVASKLALCQRRLSLQPRRAALVLEGLGEDAAQFPAAQLLRAKIAIQLDRRKEALSWLKRCDTEGAPKAIRDNARYLLEGLR
ncbi:MAG: serine/threonine-protein kinase [Planctomycetota bacterium]